MSLSCLTYLAPSVPAGLFEALAGHLGRALGTEVDLRVDATRSGPRPGEAEPFTSAEVDLAFVCATSYVWLTTGTRVVDLAGAAWAPTDPRSADRPVYFGDVLVPVDGPSADGLADLVGRRVAYNDEVSLSGYHSLRLALADVGVAAADVELVRSGSHLASLDLLGAGEVDAAAIDSNVWRRRAHEEPALGRRLCPVAALGPHPVQPPVVRADLDPEVRHAVAGALLDAHHDAEVAAELARAQLDRFVPVGDEQYAGLRAQMREVGVEAAVVP